MTTVSPAMPTNAIVALRPTLGTSRRLMVPPSLVDSSLVSILYVRLSRLSSTTGVQIEGHLPVAVSVRTELVPETVLSKVQYEFLAASPEGLEDQGIGGGTVSSTNGRHQLLMSPA